MHVKYTFSIQYPVNTTYNKCLKSFGVNPALKGGLDLCQGSAKQFINDLLDQLTLCGSRMLFPTRPVLYKCYSMVTVKPNSKLNF